MIFDSQFGRLSWIPDDQHVPEMLLSRKDALERLKMSLNENDGILSRSRNGPTILEVSEDSIQLNCE